MTRTELENVMWRAGLTSEQIAEIMPAIGEYATSQAGLSIRVVNDPTPRKAAG